MPNASQTLQTDLYNIASNHDGILDMIVYGFVNDMSPSQDTMRDNHMIALHGSMTCHDMVTFQDTMTYHHIVAIMAILQSMIIKNIMTKIIATHSKIALIIFRCGSLLWHSNYKPLQLYQR